MQARTIHPFPARMAPEIALETLNELPTGSLVLDPMVGSGTVLKQAASLGHNAIGYDMDPLAVLMSKVWTTPANDLEIERAATDIIRRSKTVDLRRAKLDWHESDEETKAFIRFWFDTPQRLDLTRLAYLLNEESLQVAGTRAESAINVLRIALSRIIVTKEQGASLARDTSHSRPHRVSKTCQFDVLDGFARSVNQLRQRLQVDPPRGEIRVSQGDARHLDLEDGTVDSVMTSPPYLNAIDYLRGHRLSLVWLGHSISELRGIRSSAIGTERKIDRADHRIEITTISRAMCPSEELPAKIRGIVERYAHDLITMVNQISRVLRPGGRATFVVGNSCLRGHFVENSAGVERAAHLAGLRTVNYSERALPSRSRYLPITESGQLAKRMRTETILTVERV
jgi:SAM-dependent methyltransferase